MLQVLQCVAECCRVLQSVAECCSMMHHDALFCSVSRCVAESRNLMCNKLPHIATHCNTLPHVATHYNTRVPCQKSKRCVSGYLRVLSHGSRQFVRHLVRVRTGLGSTRGVCSEWVAECCRVLQCVTELCSVLQCVAVCCTWHAPDLDWCHLI